mgnify:CR=1 FL=1
MTEDFEDSTNSIVPTDFDKLRLKDMSIGDKIDQEIGNWNCIKYRDCFMVSFLNHPKLRWVEFKTYSEMISFLENN